MSKGSKTISRKEAVPTARKTLCLLCALLLLLTGCGGKSKDKPDTWNLNFPGTHWGMTPAEVQEALSLEPSDYVQRYQPVFSMDEVRTDIWDGANASITFMFEDQNGDHIYSLSSVWVLYPLGTDMEAVKKAMIQEYGKPSEDRGERVVWYSEATYGDIMSEEDAAYLRTQLALADRTLSMPIDTISWTTNSYPTYKLDGQDTGYLITFDSATAFFTNEGGYASHGTGD